MTVSILAALTLVACGGSGTPPPTDNAQAAAATRAVTGSLTKGPVSGAAISLFEIDGNGFAASSDPVAQALTDATGGWSATVPASSGNLLVVATGGSYVDEADPQVNPDDRRTIALGDQARFEAVLPGGASNTAINVYTMSLLQRSRAENPGGGFQARFDLNRQAMATAMGFDPVSVLPSDPIAPAAGDSAAARQYAMALGGAANVVNALAIALGQSQPNMAVILAVVDDLVDCHIDGQGIAGPVFVNLGDGSVAVPAGQDLNTQILRFRNNNFAAYEGTPLLQINAAACGAVVVEPDVQAPVFDFAPGDVVVGASSAAGVSADDPVITATLGSFGVSDNRPGAVTVTNDAPAIFPLGNTLVTLTATDIAGNAAQAFVTVTVADLEAPVIVAPADVVVTATGDLTPVALGVPQVADNVTAPAALLVSNDAPVAGFTAGTSLVTWTVTDAAGLVASDTQQVLVEPAPPVLLMPLPDLAVTQGIAFASELGAAFTDADSSLTFTITGLPAGSGIMLNAGTGLLTGTPTPEDVLASPLSITITASDGSAAISDTFVVVVANVNDAPSFTLSGNLALVEDFTGIATITLTPDPVAVDELAQVVTYTLQPAAADIDFADIVFDPQTGSVQVTSRADANGSVDLTVSADDGQAQNNVFVANVMLTVEAVNDAPAFVTSGDVLVFEDFAEPVTVSVTPAPVPADESGQVVTYSLAPLVTFAVVSINAATGEVTIASLPNAAGIETLTITADDGQADNSVFTRSFVLAVESANDFPELVAPIGAQAARVGELFELNINANFSDPDNEALLFDLAELPANFSFNPQTGLITGTPVDLDAIIQRFDVSVTASDPNGAALSTQFELTVGHPDQDDDGLPDSVEAMMGTNPGDPDSDGDGVGDRIEVDAGGDPLTPAGTVLYVSPLGDDSASGLSWAEAKASSAGLGVVPAGQSPQSPTYVLFAGNLANLVAGDQWRLSLNSPCDNIYLVGSQQHGGFATKLTPARAPATRFAAAGGTVLTVNGCSNVVVRHLELSGGTSGGVSSTASELSIQDSVVRDNVSESSGGGVVATEGGSLEILRTVLGSNATAQNGGALSVSGGTRVRVAGSRFDGNVAAVAGGAVALDGAGIPSTIFNSSLSGNRAARGGAFALANDSGTDVAHTTVRFNQADEPGAALWFDGLGAGPRVRDSILTGNFVGLLPDTFNALVAPAVSSFNLLDIPVGGVGAIDALAVNPGLTAAGFLDQAFSPAIDSGSDTALAAGLDGEFTDPDRFAPLADTGIADRGAHASRPYNGSANDYDEPLAVQDVVNLRPGLGPQPVIITPLRNGQPIGAGHQLIATTDNAAVATLLSVTTADPLANANSVLMVDLGNGDYRFAADAGAVAGETVLSIIVDGLPVDRSPPVILRQCSPPVVCEF